MLTSYSTYQYNYIEGEKREKKPHGCTPNSVFAIAGNEMIIEIPGRVFSVYFSLIINCRPVPKRCRFYKIFR